MLDVLLFEEFIAPQEDESLQEAIIRQYGKEAAEWTKRTFFEANNDEEEGDEEE